MKAGVTRIRVFAASDVGQVRTVNQDSYFTGPVPEDCAVTHGTLLLVADGMGGHAAGEVASTLAIETIFSNYYTEELEADDDPVPALRRAFQAANQAILTAGRRDHRHFGMGTTCTALLLRGRQGWFSHVGDTRIYRYRGGALEQITRDHTLVQQMVDKGELEPDEIQRLPIKHILVRAMGSDERVEIDVSEEPFAVKRGDRFLMSSDGLHDLLGAEEIAEILTNDDGQAVVKTLTKAANSAGAPDNVTVLLAEWDDSEGS